ncbi:hypothetical protein ACOSQ4_017193 [Xanthoceras sorbifolium]
MKRNALVIQSRQYVTQSFLFPALNVSNKPSLASSHKHSLVQSHFVTQPIATTYSNNVQKHLLQAQVNENLWHKKLGHPASLVLKHVMHKLHFKGTSNHIGFSDLFMLGKLH